MFSDPFCFLITRNERARIKSKIQLLFQRGAEASSSLKRNKWGQPVRGNVYAGFELELAGAERPLKQSETATRRGRFDPAASSRNALHS
jgi:hypothetical protein